MSTVAPVVFTTKLPRGVKQELDRICDLLGLKKTHVVESALREKLEDLLDAHELREAMREGDVFTPWEEVKKELRRKGRL